MTAVRCALAPLRVPTVAAQAGLLPHRTPPCPQLAPLSAAAVCPQFVFAYSPPCKPMPPKPRPHPQPSAFFIPPHFNTATGLHRHQPATHMTV